MDYANGKIYQIVSNSTGLCYIGSTTQPLCKRMAFHRKDKRQYEAGKGVYMTSFQVMDCEDANIELIEDFPCERKEQLHAREGYWIREKACVNRCEAGRTKAKYRQDNKDKIRTWHAEYRQANRDKINAQKGEHYQANRDKILAQKAERIPCPRCGSVVRRYHMARHQRTNKCKSSINACDTKQAVAD